jgi:hypothetical protein
MNAENFTEEIVTIEGNSVRVVTYRIAEEYYCHVYNLDPGACIARFTSVNREKAKEEALAKAKQRLLKTAGNH